jgi:hypothetical protein
MAEEDPEDTRRAYDLMVDIEAFVAEEEFQRLVSLVVLMV